MTHDKTLPFVIYLQNFLTIVWVFLRAHTKQVRLWVVLPQLTLELAGSNLEMSSPNFLGLTSVLQLSVNRWVSMCIS